MEIMNKQLIIFFIEHLPLPLAQSELEAYASTSYALSNGRSARVSARGGYACSTRESKFILSQPS